RLRERGMLVAGGPLPDRPGTGMTVVRVADPLAAEQVVSDAQHEDGSVTSGLLDVTVRPWRAAMTSAASCGRPAACRPPVPGTGRSVAARGGDVLVVADNLLDDEAQELLRKDRVQTCLLRERPKPCDLTTLTLRIGGRQAEIGLDVPHLLGA